METALVNRMKIITALLLFRVIYNVTVLHARIVSFALYIQRRSSARHRICACNWVCATTNVTV